MRSARTIRRTRLSCRVQQPSPVSPRLRFIDRKSLLLGTALASTLLLGGILAPTPAQAVVNCPVATHPLPGPIVGKTSISTTAAS